MVTCTDRCVIVSFPLPTRHPLLQGTATYAAQQPTRPPAAQQQARQMWFSRPANKRNEQLLLRAYDAKVKRSCGRVELQELLLRC